MKRALSVVLCFVFAVMSVPLAALQTRAGGGDAAFINGYTGGGGNVVIPSQIGGYAVKGIDEQAFWNCPDVTGVTIPAGVTQIGVEAFADCESLAAMTVEAGNPVYHSDGNCIIETASKTLVAGCRNSVIPSDGSVTSIGNHAFYCCVNLKNITIPDSVTSIGRLAFGKCENLDGIAIPAGVNSIGDLALGWCGSLESITVDANNPVYHSYKNCLIETAGKRVLRGCKNSVIPSDGSVKKIGEWAFSGCKGLKSIVIPNGVDEICEGAFDVCEDLAGVTLPGSLTVIGGYSFYGCEKLANIAIPEGVTYIGDYAFSECPSVTGITVPAGVAVIAVGAFSYCSGLKSVAIPEGVTCIDDYAFCGCESLTAVTVPDGVTQIGREVFSGCKSLETMTVAGNNPVYHSSGNCIIGTASKKLIAGCKNSVIPSDGSVKSIGESAFFCCADLESITIPGGVTAIGESAFAACENLESIILPAGLTSIGEYAFDLCIRLGTVYYTGTEEQWAEIEIGSANEPLTNAEIIYGYVFEYVPGDVNGNGKIDSADYAMCKRAYLKTFTLSAEQLMRADINTNGKVDSSEYAMIKRHFLKTYVIPGAEGK
ncbi:MAG: leucine-rich repeat protein [Clostridia bacterium]|nr:leucine-rich repeat protein [Clostridia bacterium]